jgi:ubiquinone/menaquinone biosynthesis C-methylase UbiE
MKPSSDFDGIAPYYDLLAKLVFGRQLNLAQRHFINRLGNPSKILILGGGSGGILEPILANYPTVHIYYLESSVKMLSLAKTRYSPDHYPIDYVLHRGDSQFPIRSEFEVIITPFVLDVFGSDELTIVVRELLDSLKWEGLWIHTDFYTDNGGPWWRFLLVKMMYGFFRITTGMKNQKLPDFDSIFEDMRLTSLGEKSYFHRLVKTTMYQKLRPGTKPLKEVSQHYPDNYRQHDSD